MKLPLCWGVALIIIMIWSSAQCVLLLELVILQCVFVVVRRAAFDCWVVLFSGGLCWRKGRVVWKRNQTRHHQHQKQSLKTEMMTMMMRWKSCLVSTWMRVSEVFYINLSMWCPFTWVGESVVINLDLNEVFFWHEYDWGLHMDENVFTSLRVSEVFYIKLSMWCPFTWVGESVVINLDLNEFFFRHEYDLGLQVDENNVFTSLRVSEVIYVH